MKTRTLTNTLAASAVAILALSGCGEDSGGTGRVQVFVEPEDTIPEGLEPGSGEENIQDGWTVTYDKFLVAVGNFRATRSADTSDQLSEPRVYVVDLKNVPTGGLVIAEFNDVTASRWDKVGFDLQNASASNVRAESTAQADYDFMVSNGYSIYIEATMTNPTGQSCLPAKPTDCVSATSVTFKWGLAAGTSFDDCAPESGDAGFAVPSGGTVQVKPTIHGDHWFFTNITQGAEITERRAQWIANCDVDRNGETTLDELRGVQAADVFPSPPYNLSGAIIPVNTAFDYLEAQTRTLGDFQGDGECPTRQILP
jgi:hypothetical protein